jgi:hypothetical protein
MFPGRAFREKANAPVPVLLIATILEPASVVARKQWERPMLLHNLNACMLEVPLGELSEFFKFRGEQHELVHQ